MKQNKLFFIIVLFIFACSLAIFCQMIPYCSEHWNNFNMAKELDLQSLNFYLKKAIRGTVTTVFCGISMLLSAFLFFYCNPKLFRRSTWVNLSDEWAKNKEERAAARAAKADADKQKRIEELQAELQELKKDE